MVEPLAGCHAWGHGDGTRPFRSLVAYLRHARRLATSVLAGVGLMVLTALPPRAGFAATVPEAAVFGGTPAVGALFTISSSGRLGPHFCSASVVVSPHHDLVVTAAHCVSKRPAASFVFIPDYANGARPYGIWHVERILVGPAWAKNADPDDDVAFVVLRASAAGKNVQDLTGGERLGIDRSPGKTTVIGYPDRLNSPIRCQNMAKVSATNELEFDCGGYTTGTSGSPFLVGVSHSTGTGTVIGVIGGYEEGGRTPSISYAARFEARVSTLYRRATR